MDKKKIIDEAVNSYLQRFNSINSYVEKYDKKKRINEFNFYSGGDVMDEAGEEEPATPNNGGGDPNANAAPPPTGGAPQSQLPQEGTPPPTPADPNVGGDMGGMDMNADPNAMNADPNAMGAGGDPNAMPPVDDGTGGFEDIDVEQEGDNVLDITDLTSAQEETNNEVQQLDDKFNVFNQFAEKLTQAIEKIVTKAEEQDQEIQSVKDELIHRMPTPVEKLNIRSVDSFPFNVKIDDYWKERSKVGDKYSIDFDNKNETPETEEYILTDDDVNQINDEQIYQSFNKSLRDLVS